MTGAPEAHLAVGREWGADAILDLHAAPAWGDRLVWVRDHTAGSSADIVFQWAITSVLLEAIETARPPTGA
jgi:hypothetical protein